MPQENQNTDLTNIHLKLTPIELNKFYKSFLMLHEILGLGNGFLSKMVLEINKQYNEPENLKKISSLYK